MKPSRPSSDPTFTLSPLSLVLGGARSGKSSLAERLIILSGLPRTYVATAQAFDDEMRARIERHRQKRGKDWKVIEAPQDIAGVLRSVPMGEIVLIDCISLWLSNIMLAGADIEEATRTLIQAVQRCPASVVVVSNEVGWGIVPENALARRFRDAQGLLNQRLAQEAGLVVVVMAGLPVVLKGQLAKGVL